METRKKHRYHTVFTALLDRLVHRRVSTVNVTLQVGQHGGFPERENSLYLQYNQYCRRDQAVARPNIWGEEPVTGGSLSMRLGKGVVHEESGGDQMVYR